MKYIIELCSYNEISLKLVMLCTSDFSADAIESNYV
jgi:hypothetical protein